MTALADRTMRDLVPVLDRYRPAALAATAIIVAVAVLPGASGGSGITAPAAFDAGFVEDADDDATQGVASSDSSSGAVDGPTAPSAAPMPRSSPSPSPSFSSPRPSASPASGASPAPAPTFDPSPSTGSGDVADDAPEQLRIVAAGYASTTGGTPLPPEVPEGSLPVGARVDQVDKASYLRLDGNGSALVLTELADGRRGSDFETAPVQACQITDAGWEPAENMGFADAPAHDPDVCVVATMLADGRWSIPLTAFADPTDDRGIALVPAPDAPIDFQVTFASTVAS